MDVALAARYITAPAFSVYMLFAVFPFVLKWLTVSASSTEIASGPKELARIPIVGTSIPFLTPQTAMLIKSSFVTAVCFAHLCFSFRSVTSFENENIRYSAGKAAVLFSRSFLDRDLLANVWFERLMPKYKEMIDFMDEQDFLRPNTFQTARIYDLPKVYDSKTVQPGAAGGIEQAGNVGEGNVGFSGWAMLPDRKSPPDVVLLSAGSNEDAVVFGIIPVGGRRPEIEQQLGVRPFKGFGWGRVFPKNLLPTSATQVRAWAFDCDTGTAYEMGGAIDFKPQ